MVPSCSRRQNPAWHPCSAGQPVGSPRVLRPRWREVTGLRAHARRSGPTHPASPKWRNQEPRASHRPMERPVTSGLRPAYPVLSQDRPRGAQRRCKQPVAVKANGELAKSRARCLERRARSCKTTRRHAAGQDGDRDPDGTRADQLSRELPCGLPPAHAIPAAQRAQQNGVNRA